MYKVYLVDDEQLIIQSLIDAIPWQDHGLVLTGVNTDAQKAIQDISTQKPDLVFCDLKMPTGSGLQVIETCRARGVESEFIMLSAYAEFEASRKFFLEGGFDYLLKPVDTTVLQTILEKVCRKLLEKNPPAYKETEREDTDTFQDILQYLEKHMESRHTLKSLSQKFYLSETYICDLFAKKLSITFTVYMTNLRMRKALSLIQSTKKSLKEVGLLCGYQDYFYFCRVFKNYYGKAPSEYRSL